MIVEETTFVGANDPMKPIFTDFAALLETRLRRDVPTTEDSVRYTLFASLLRNQVEPHSVILEYSHPEIRRARIDTWLTDFRGGAVAIEFKYDRDPPGGKNPPTTQKAGALFADLRRLHLVSDRAAAYLVYLTTKPMDVYLSSPERGHRELYELAPGKSLAIGARYFANKPATFQGAAGGVFEASVSAVLGRRFAGHSLRVYSVE
ncbi:MAG: hypothetical protein OXK76_16195 [Gammaproteobacteria bacterium]|nr:hypothetical protein [Gammaproteobacteria bacterium]